MIRSFGLLAAGWMLLLVQAGLATGTPPLGVLWTSGPDPAGVLCVGLAFFSLDIVWCVHS